MVLQAAAVTTFGLGLATILVPDLIVRWFDGDNSESHHFVRFIGTALIGFSVTNWIYSNLKDLRAVLPAVYGNLTSVSLAIFIDLIGLALGMLGRAAWLILALHAVFAVAFTYCIVLIKKPPQSRLKR